MKRTIWLLIGLFIVLTASAQEQKGIVKTRGRMVNGSLVPGTGLSDATVQLGDRSVVTKDVKGRKGTFSFPAKGNSYVVKGVNKQGYQLVDLEVCRTYKYSADPLYLVMETPEKQRSDLLAAERKIRRNLQQQLQQREDEIDALNASNEEKDSLLRILYQQQTDNEKLIADMAKRYSTLDYDQLDEFYRKVSLYIENGELTRADSLLRTRGNIIQQVEALIQQGQVIEEQKEHLQKAERVHQADVDEAARRCYSYHETFFAQHQNDSAAYYLELRAQLDTTNVKWQNLAGWFIYNYLADYGKALVYYQLVLRQSMVQYGSESEWVATAYNNIGTVYYSQGNYPKALEYLSKALAISERVLGNEHPDVATAYNNIGGVYKSQGDYTKALEYHNKALAICEKVLGPEHPDVATSYSNIGTVYSHQGDYPKALEYHGKALAIRERVLGTEHPDVATSYNNIGLVYNSQGNYAKALEYHNKALAIWERVLGTENPDIATSYNNIGLVYDSQGDYAKALEYYGKALAIREKVLGTEHPDVAQSYNNIGGVYCSQGNYAKALECHSKALAIYEKVFGPEHPDTKSIKENLEGVKSKITK